MKFTKCVGKMKTVAGIISKKNDTWAAWVALGLMRLSDFPEVFDNCIGESPFLEHFLLFFDGEVKTKIDEDEVLSLFEDIVVFVCEKKLYLGSSYVDKFEENILDFFEQCGEWHELDGTLISEWVWHHLPLRALKKQVQRQNPNLPSYSFAFGENQSLYQISPNNNHSNIR